MKDYDIKLWKYGVSLLAQYGSRVPAITSAPQLSQQKLVNSPQPQPEAKPNGEVHPQRAYISYRTIEENTAQKVSLTSTFLDPLKNSEACLLSGYYVVI